MRKVLILTLVFLLCSNGLVMAAPEYKDANPNTNYSPNLLLLPNNNLLYINTRLAKDSELYDPDFNVLQADIMHQVTGAGHLLGTYRPPSGSINIYIYDINTGERLASGHSASANPYNYILEELPGYLLLTRPRDCDYLAIVDLSGNTKKRLTNVTGKTVKEARLYNGNKVRVLFEQSDGTVKDYWIDCVTYSVKENPSQADLSVGVYYPDLEKVRQIESFCSLPNGVQLNNNIISKNGHIIANIAASHPLKYIYNEANGRLYMVNCISSSGIGKPRMITNAVIDRITDLQAHDITTTSAKITLNRGNMDPSFDIKVQYKRDGSQWIDLPPLTGYESSFEIHDLLPDTNYTVRVRSDFIDLFLGRTPSDGDWQPEYLSFRTKTQLQADIEEIFATDISSPDSPTNNGLVTKTVAGREYVALGETFNNIFNRTTNLENSIVPVIQEVKGKNNATVTTNGTFTAVVEAYGATEYRAKSDVTGWTEWTTDNKITLSGLSMGARTITVEARNATGNVSSRSMTIFSL